MRRSGRVGVTLMACVMPLAAQGDCHPSVDSHEAQAFAILSVPLAFGAGGAPAAPAVGIEFASIPRVPEDLATPTTCRPGKGPENTNPLAGFARLRGTLSIAGLLLEVGWIPPVPLAGVEAHLVGLAIARPMRPAPRLTVTPRVHALVGTVHGPFTCDDRRLADPASECFSGVRSRDRWSPTLFGGELLVARDFGAMRLHAAVGGLQLRPRFRVGFTNAQGETDRRRVEVDLWRWSVTAGGSRRLGAWHLALEGHVTVGDRAAVRLVARHLLGSG